MKRLRTLAAIIVCSLVVSAPRWSQDKTRPGPGRARITIYRVAAGKHLEFLRWMAAQDDVLKEAGLPTVQLYTHLNGDSWDYVGIAPVTTPEEDKKADEIAASKGLKTGFAASLEFRDLLVSHTDTFAVGPTSAAELVTQATK